MTGLVESQLGDHMDCSQNYGPCLVIDYITALNM